MGLFLCQPQSSEIVLGFVADSAEATGLKWATAAGGAGNMVLIASGSLSGASVTISSLSTYTELFLQFQDVTNNTGNGDQVLRINGNTGSNYENFGYRYSTAFNRWQGADTYFYLAGDSINRTDATNQFTVKFTNCKTTGFTDCLVVSEYVRGGGGNGIFHTRGIYSVSETVSSISFFNTAGTYSAGTYKIWGA